MEDLEKSPSRLILAFAVCAVLISCSTRVMALEVFGHVVAILDGDTIEVLHNSHPERIRLSGIDCPEKGQANGQKAKQAASALVFGKEVTLQTHGKDKYKRSLANVLLPDGTNVNHALVKEGWCWWYRKYAPGDTILEGLEKSAREAKKGLWADPHPVPPWEWRKRDSHFSHRLIFPSARTPAYDEAANVQLSPLCGQRSKQSVFKRLEDPQAGPRERFSRSHPTESCERQARNAARGCIVHRPGEPEQQLDQ